MLEHGPRLCLEGASRQSRFAHSVTVRRLGGNGGLGNSILTRFTLEAIVPARNEARRIRSVISEILRYVDAVIVVDDASSDETSSIAQQTGARVIRLESRLGINGALLSGIRASTAAILVTLDGDGEHDASYIPKMISPIESGAADIVFGTPGRPLRWTEGIISALVRPIVGIDDTGCGYRAIRGDLARKLTLAGSCPCGTLALEANRHGARFWQVPITLRKVEQTRSPAWGHLIQMAVVGSAIVRHVILRQGRPKGRK